MRFGLMSQLQVPKPWFMRVYMFHLMPWPHLPADFAQTHDTAWVERFLGYGSSR